MGIMKDLYLEILEQDEELALAREIELAFDKIIDHTQNCPTKNSLGKGWENICKHKRSDYPMALTGLGGMWYYCKKCGTPMAKFIPYGEREDK